MACQPQPNPDLGHEQDKKGVNPNLVLLFTVLGTTRFNEPKPPVGLGASLKTLLLMTLLVMQEPPALGGLHAKWTISVACQPQRLATTTTDKDGSILRFACVVS